MATLSQLTEFSQQSYFEQGWRHMTDNYSKFAIATWGSLFAHEIAYFLIAAPGFLFQFIPAMQKLKIQPDKPETWDNQWKCMKLIIFSHFFIQLPMISATFTYTEIMAIPYEYDKIPAWYTIVIKAFICLALEDLWHYIFHRMLHHGALYKHIHKIHHNFQAPFGIAAEYAHPLETVILGGGFFIGVVLFTDHLVFMWVWMSLRVLEAVDAHSGYNHWQPLHLLPFYGGAHFHDFHHRVFVSNYASTFTYLDRLFGTDQMYRSFYKSEDKQD